MHQEQFQLHGRELDDLTKRNQQLFDQWTRVDVECSRVTEDLQISNGRVEQLRNECANLRAEKKIWEVRRFLTWKEKPTDERYRVYRGVLWRRIGRLLWSDLTFLI